MPAPYDYSSSSGYSRTRADWVDFPTTTTPITATQLDKLDQALFDTKVVTVNVKDYGAVGDGSTNDFTALTNAYAATPEGGTMLIPVGNFKANSQLVFNRRVNIVGCGVGSAITVNVGTSTDGIIVGTTTLLYGVVCRDFAVLGGASACRYGIVFRNLAHSFVDRVYVKCGTVASTGYAASIEGCLITRFKLVAPGSNMTFPYSATANVNGVRVVGSAAYPSNANHLDLVIEAITGEGLTGDASVGAAGSFNNFITGTYEGITGAGIALKNWSEFTIRDTHLEGSTPGGTNNKLRVDGCARAHVGPGVFSTNLIEVAGVSYDITWDGVTCNDFTVASGSLRMIYGRLNYNIVSGGAFTDASSINTVASNTTLDLPVLNMLTHPAALVTGTTNITSITVGYPGQIYTLIFQGILAVSDGGGNIKLAGGFTSSADDTLTLVCDGVSWFEMCRAVN